MPRKKRWVRVNKEFNGTEELKELVLTLEAELKANGFSMTDLNDYNTMCFIKNKKISGSWNGYASGVSGLLETLNEGIDPHYDTTDKKLKLEVDLNKLREEKNN